ncbi:MAG: hypothetical protein QXT73_05160 [Candidatus Methanomethylicaceae archaeon]
MKLNKTERAILKALSENNGCLPSAELCKLVKTRNAGRVIAYARRLRWRGLVKTREDELTDSEIERLFISVFRYPRSRVYWVISDTALKNIQEVAK